MDHFANQTRAGVPRAEDHSVGPTDDGATGLGLVKAATGQVIPRQQRYGARLSQTVEVHRRDGSVWTAFDRQLTLPTDPGDADRAAAQASCVLGLLARAVAAADTARQARGAMLEWDMAPPPWTAHYL